MINIQVTITAYYVQVIIK